MPSSSKTPAADHGEADRVDPIYHKSGNELLPNPAKLWGGGCVCYIFMSIIYLTATQRRDIFLLLIHFLQEPGLGQGKARSVQLQPGCRPAVWQGPTHLYQLLLPLILCYQEVAALMGDPVYPRGSLTHCATRIATRKFL